MPTSVSLKCWCGSVTGNLEIIKGSFFHVHCLCRDCQKFASKLGNSEKILNEHGGSELFQTYPQYLTITQGNENIRCLRLNEKGLYRWHTSCCNMPIANTMSSYKVPFAGISVKLMQFANQQEKDAILGPVTLKAFGKDALGDMPADTHPEFPKSYLPKILLFMLKGFIGKKYLPSPFFKGKEPVSAIQVLPSK